MKLPTANNEQVKTYQNPVKAASVAAVLRRIARSRLAGPMLLLVICSGFCWKLIFSNEYTWIDDPDITNMDVPRLQFQGATWRNHEFPLWDPRLWCGQPFLGQIVGAAFPFNWPFFLLKPNSKNQISFRQLNWYYFVLHFLGALFAYWLCRELDVSRTGSVFGGFVFSFSGFFALTLWPEVVGGLMIAPLVLLFLLRALQRQRPFASASLCGMCLGLAWLSGHHEIPIYLSLAVAAIWLYDLVWHRAEWPRSLAMIATSLLFAVLTSGFQTIPGYEYAKLAVRWAGADHPVEWNETIPYKVDVSYSLTPSSVIAIIVPWGGQNGSAYAGIVVFSLALIAICALWQTRWVRLFTWFALAGLLLALGGWNLFHGLLYAVLPLFHKARNPNRLLSMFGLGLAILAAFGLDCLRTSLRMPLLRTVRVALLVLAGFIVALQLAAPALQKPGPGEYLFMLALIALLFAGVLFAGQNGAFSNRSLTVAVIALALIELGNVSTSGFRERTPERRESLLANLSQFSDLADFLRHQPELPRVNATEVTGIFNLGDWEGIDTLTGFGAGLTKNIRALDWQAVRTQNLLAITYSLSKQLPRSDQQVVFRGANGISVLRNADALPRARIVHKIESATSVKDLRTRLGDTSFDGRSTVVMLGPAPSLQSCAGEEQARISRRSANSVVIDAKAACRGMLILADTWYPGWMATIDGHPAAIQQAYLALRGVVLEQGDHRVEFHYEPASALIGAVMSAVGILGAGMLALLERHRIG